VAPLTDVRDLSRIAYGFMASKALFAALNLGLFDRLAADAKPFHVLAEETGVAPKRLLTLITACVSLGLLERRGDRYANAPASQTYLVRTAPAYFGDYYRFQIDRQIYPAFVHLDAALQGEHRDFYGLMKDTQEAESFSRAQHSGSLGPAHVLARLVDLAGREKLLDVGGGTGAFSISLCRRYPALRATIIDFPAVRDLSDRLVEAAALQGRITFLPGDALHTEWPRDQDVILMSYLLSAVAEPMSADLLARAFRSLRDGGLLVVHDFMVDDDRRGPPSAALWLLASLLMNPDVPSLTPRFLCDLTARHGFRDPLVKDVIPTITKVLTASKPSDTPSDR
jgi:2-hydroxy-4-(methylsulfanyl)butanoate S-methyltransferase